MKTDKTTLHELADGIVFAESEVTAELEAACISHGISLNIVPDNQYAEAVATGFGEWLIKNYPPNNG